MKTILASIDFSGATDAVLKNAVELTSALKGRLVVLHVIQPPVNLSASDPTLIRNSARITEAAEKAADKRLLSLGNGLKGEVPLAEVIRITGAPVAKILEQAEMKSADFIVMGSHGHSAVYDLLVGSTTHGVLNKASCPVIVVPKANDQKRIEIGGRAEAYPA